LATSRASGPASGALIEAGITTLEQVDVAGRRKLLAMHGVGSKAVRILTEALAELGIDVAD
jgi:hypothetical protein